MFIFVIYVLELIEMKVYQGLEFLMKFHHDKPRVLDHLSGLLSHYLTKLILLSAKSRILIK